MKAIKKPTQSALAAALGLDPSLVTRYKRRGMPVHSIEAANRWREENLRVRYAPEKDHEAVRRAIDGEAAAGLATSLMQAAGELFESGGDVRPLIGTIGTALASVPPSQRQRVGLHFGVMDLMTDKVAKVLDRGDPQNRICGRLYQADRDAGEWSEGVDMGAFWYGVAAGEIGLSPA